jgi:hypothetical protein
MPFGTGGGSQQEERRCDLVRDLARRPNVLVTVEIVDLVGQAIGIQTVTRSTRAH